MINDQWTVISKTAPQKHIPTARPELVEGLPVLRQAQHERHNTIHHSLIIVHWSLSIGQ
jgi:hypothetical protein